MKRKYSELDVDNDGIEGYVLEVSELKTSAKGIGYFDGKFQTKKDVMRFVSFTPEKKDSFDTAKCMKSPIKLSNARISPQKGSNEIVFSKQSHMQVVKNLNFTCVPEKATSSNVTTEKLGQLLSAGKMCNIVAKVVQLSEEKTVTTKYGVKSLKTATVADDTGSLSLPLWGNKSKLVDLDQTYIFKNLYTKLFDTQLQLSTTVTTEITLTEDMVNTKSSALVEPETFAGVVITCAISSKHRCLMCFNTLDFTDESVDKVQCCLCQAKMKLKNTTKQLTCKLQIQDSNNDEKKINIPADVFNNFLEKNDLKNKTIDEIEDLLLDSQNVIVKFRAFSEFATDMSIE